MKREGDREGGRWTESHSPNGYEDQGWQPGLEPMLQYEICCHRCLVHCITVIARLLFVSLVSSQENDSNVFYDVFVHCVMCL